MIYVTIISLVLLLTWSAFSLMHSRQKAKKDEELFYSEVIPFLNQYQLEKSKTQFPILIGNYGDYKIKLVPEVDTLVLHSIPRLYLRMYIYISNTALLRLRKYDLSTYSTHFFRPSSFEKENLEIQINDQEYYLFLAEDKYPLTLEDSLSRIIPQDNNCAEVLIQKKFIRITILLARGKKSSYVVTRVASFPSLIFKYDSFKKYFQTAIDLHKEVN